MTPDPSVPPDNADLSGYQSTSFTSDMQSSIPYENIFDQIPFDETCIPPSALVNQPEFTENYAYSDLYENELHGDEIYSGLLPSHPWEGMN